MILRVALLLVAISGFAGALAIERPDRFAVTTPAALLTIVLDAGAVAADAIPLRRVPLITSIATVACGFALFARGEVHIPLTAVLAALQVVAVVWIARAKRGVERRLSGAGL